MTNLPRSQKSMLGMATTAPDPMHDYQAQDDFHVLKRAEEVKTDPARHKKAIEHGKQQIRSMRKVVARGQRVKNPVSGEPPSGGFTPMKAF